MEVVMSYRIQPKAYLKESPVRQMVLAAAAIKWEPEECVLET